MIDSNNYALHSGTDFLFDTFGTIRKSSFKSAWELVYHGKKIKNHEDRNDWLLKGLETRKQ